MALVVRSELRVCRMHICVFHRPIEPLAVLEHLVVDAMAYLFPFSASRVFLGVNIYRSLFDYSLNVCNKR
jgi:hypothetical protein